MATSGSAASSKRKIANGSKPLSNKKPKTDKKAPPPEEESDEVEDDGDAFADFSEDDDEGGALVQDEDEEMADAPARAKSIGNQNGKDKGQTSRETHQKQKALALERKNAKPLADELHRTKKIWERLRRKSHVPKDERDKLVEELFAILTGRMKEFALKHDSTRVVQTAVKYSTPERRKMIAIEMKGSYQQLAESKYAKFLIGKLLVEGDKEVRDIIVPEFYGKVRKLINHPEASWILDDVYRTVASKEQKSILLREWYGAEFALFRQVDAATAPSAELSKILEEQPGKRNQIMKYLADMTNQLVQKKMTGFTMLHDAMLQYFLNVKVDSKEQKEMIEMTKQDETGDMLKNMAFTKSGARLVCLMLAYGTAKDRKQILKTYKDTYQLMAADPHGHLIILAAFDLVDDTVFSSKTIISELLGKTEQDEVSNVVIAANDPNGRLTVRYVFEGKSKSLFPPSHSWDIEVLDEIAEIRKTTSKKDPETRRMELVAAISPILFAAIVATPEELVSTSFGCQLVSEALLSGVGDKAEALQAIASTAGGDPDEGNEQMDTSEEGAPEKPAQTHISKTPHGGRMFKTLIAGGHFDKTTRQIIPVDPPLNFADILYPVIKDHIISWATGPSSFVPVSLLEAKDFSHGDELRKTLKKEKKALTKAATEETAEQKAAREAAEAGAGEDKDKAKAKKGKKSGPKKERSVGNMGAKLLLEKL